MPRPQPRLNLVTSFGPLDGYELRYGDSAPADVKTPFAPNSRASRCLSNMSKHFQILLRVSQLLPPDSVEHVLERLVGLVQAPSYGAVIEKDTYVSLCEFYTAIM